MIAVPPPRAPLPTAETTAPVATTANAPTAPASPASPNRAAWDRAGNVLCVRLDTLGDVLMTTPAIRAIKLARPGRRVTLLTGPAGAAVAAMVPEIDDIITYDAPWMKATAARVGNGNGNADGDRPSRREFEMIERLRAGGFDAAVVFTVFSQNPLPAAMTAYLADIPLRAAHCREQAYQLLTDRIPETDGLPEHGGRIRHEVRRQLDLVAALGCVADDERMSLAVPSSARREIAALLAELGLDAPGVPWAVLHPGATAASRRYPPELFAEAAAGMAGRLGCRIVFTGDASERELVEDIRRRTADLGAESVSLAGLLGLPQTAALIAAAPLLVSNNTGPAHIAAAVGTPVVDLYALTNPQHTPWGVPHRVLSHDVPCRWCYRSVCPMGHHDCLRKVPPADVVRAAAELLGLRPSNADFAASQGGRLAPSPPYSGERVAEGRVRGN
jgi:lipopolysaccharide heptosyltransferase II